MDLGDIRGRESEGVEFILVLEKYHLFIPYDNPGPITRITNLFLKEDHVLSVR